MTREPLLSVRGLRTYFHTETGEVRAVDGVDLSLDAGETLGIVGESGSGKSVAAYSILRLLPEGIGGITGGSIVWRGGVAPVDLATLPLGRLHVIRGTEIAMIFQEPMTSLNPVYTCGWQVAESLRFHRGASRRVAWAQATRLLDEVGIPDPADRMHRYPHELSGGMKQRVMIAMALACEPKLLICDEPTTALDVTTQKQILALIGRLQRERGMAVLFISHDLAVIAEVTDRVAVLREGRVVEFGDVAQIFLNPRHPYTKGLVACRPTLETRSARLPTIEDFLRAEREGTVFRPPEAEAKEPGPESEEPALEVGNLRTWFPVRRGLITRDVGWVKAVDGVGLRIFRGRTLGLVGESGCGKTTLGRTLLRLEEPRQGSSIRFDGKDIMDLDARRLREFRRRAQIVFQDPYSSLNPRLTVSDALVEPMQIHRLGASSRERRARAADLLDRVGLSSSHLDRYPHALSGGQRQRVCIARALAVEPDFLVLDEAVSALDVSVQAGVINLLLDLQDQLGLTYLFISHDLSVVKFVSDEVAVMCTDRAMRDLFRGDERERLERRDRGGHIVERKPAEELYAAPEHPYTKALIAAIPGG